MPTATLPLPLTVTIEPTEQAEVAATLRQAFADETPVYPLGGRTALGFGLTAKRPGLGLSTTGLKRIIDYPARDMTITVEAGTTIAELAQVLAAENQYLPLDVAQPGTATVGGVMAANFSGPRRYGYGTFRDYIIGVSAVDGTGTAFKAGGRVVKNVAGYDFCKLLTGSLGTLAVVTQVTLKVRPRPQASALMIFEGDLLHTEAQLLRLTHTRTTPTAIELLSGPAWDDLPGVKATGPGTARIVIGFEGSATEVSWQRRQLREEWQAGGASDAAPIAELTDAEAAPLWTRLTEFGAAAEPTSPVVKINTVAGRVVEAGLLIQKHLPNASCLTHAGNGIVLVDCGELSTADAAKLLIRELRPFAMRERGQAVVWNGPPSDDWTSQAYWGPTREDDAVMKTVKRTFDPKGLLNPGRFNL
jgi:glycolate oxidase FAD binding subunit